MSDTFPPKKRHSAPVGFLRYHFIYVGDFPTFSPILGDPRSPSWNFKIEFLWTAPRKRIWPVTTVAGWIVVGVVWRFGATCTLNLKSRWWFFPRTLERGLRGNSSFQTEGILYTHYIYYTYYILYIIHMDYRWIYHRKSFFALKLKRFPLFDVLWSTTRGRDFWYLQLLCC